MCANPHICYILTIKVYNVHANVASVTFDMLQCSDVIKILKHKDLVSDTQNTT